MNLNSSETDKRRHKRYKLASGGFALLQAKDNEVLGSIVDISDGGLCLLHIDGAESILEDSPVAINLISDDIYYKQFSGRSIWSKKEKGGFSTALVKMKRRGIQFEDLSQKMQGQISKFIDSLKKN